MNPPARLLVFGAVLALVFGGAMLAGATLDPRETNDTGVSDHPDSNATSAAHDEDASEGEHSTPDPVRGLGVSQGGYILRPEKTHFEAGHPERFEFSIEGSDGQVVRDAFKLEFEREVHLIVVRRDAAFYEHLHPSKNDAGVWSTPLALPKAGVYRAYVDFVIANERLTLATDLFVAGSFQPIPLPSASPTASIDGYDVALRTERLQAGGSSELTFSVTRDSRAVGDLGLYLGAKGHLVALRTGDLAYSHAHPDDRAVAANEIRFIADFPTRGRYRLFLQFNAGGEVRTVAYTLDVPR